MYTDFHNHALYDIDDGASTIDETLEMLCALRAQNVRRVILTPHFYIDQNVSSFIRNRKSLYSSIRKSLPNGMKIGLGAEVMLAKGISTEIDLSKLTIAKSNYIMLELPLFSFEDWINTELHNILYKHKLIPIFSSIERYNITYSRDEFNKIISTPGAVFQFSTKAFTNDENVKILKKLLSNNKTILFGTNSHNMTSRRPDYEILNASLKGKLDPLTLAYLNMQNDRFLRSL